MYTALWNLPPMPTSSKSYAAKRWQQLLKPKHVKNNPMLTDDTYVLVQQEHTNKRQSCKAGQLLESLGAYVYPRMAYLRSQDNC